MAFRLNDSVFAGMSPTVLAAALSTAQQALIALQTGQQVVTVSYGEGSGAKAVTYRAPDKGGLVQLINELQACLGLRRHSRRGFQASF
jgi:3-hydroxy-3-methylglutaryl CoA synthase